MLPIVRMVIRSEFTRNLDRKEINSPMLLHGIELSITSSLKVNGSMGSVISINWHHRRS